MIRKRRRKKKIELQRKQRLQIGIVLGGAMLAALLAAILPSQCNVPPSENQLREQIEDLARGPSAHGDG